MGAHRSSRLYYSWPVALLLVVEAFALAWVTELDRALPPLTAISIGAAVIALVVGIAPLLTQPSPATRLGSCMILLLAAFLLVPVRPEMLTHPVERGLLLTTLPAYALYRLINGAYFVVLAYQVAGHFPTQALRSRASRPTGRAIAHAYLIMALLLGALLLVPLPPLRAGLFVATMGWIYLLVGRTVWRLASLSRDPNLVNGQARQQARVLLFSALLAAIPSLLLNLAELLNGTPLVRADFASFFLILFPIGTAYAILRHDLLTIDWAARRALAYTALSALALLLYFMVTLLLTVGVARRWPGLLRIVGAVSVFAATLLFAPLQQRVQQLVDRWFYPERKSFLSAIDAARHTLGTIVERQAVLQLLTHTLPTQLGAPWAMLALAPAPLTLPPQSSAPGWSGTLIVGETRIGRYWLAPRQSLPHYEADEEAQLQQLLQEAALVLAYAETIATLRQLNDELEARVAARTEQLLTQQRALAAHEQRQQLARDLHDSVTQSLFSLNLSLRAIRKVGERDPQAAVAELAAQEASAQQALTEMRTLLSQLRTDSVAEERGGRGEGERGEGERGGRGEGERGGRGEGERLSVNLAERLQGLCTEVERRGELHIALNTPPVIALAAPVVDEVSYIVREALHNVVKHSGQDRATVTVAVVEETLFLHIHDQGQGFGWRPALAVESDGNTAIAPREAYGLKGMQERAQQLGGLLHIESAPLLGTTLSLQMPLVDHSFAGVTKSR